MAKRTKESRCAAPARALESRWWKELESPCHKAADRKKRDGLQPHIRGTRRARLGSRTARPGHRRIASFAGVASMAKTLHHQIVARAREIIADRDHWIQGQLALSGDGHPVDPTDERARRYCAV